MISTDEEWEIEIRRHSLNYKHDKQLEEMLVSHQAKLPLVEKDLYWLNRFPDFKRKELWEEVLRLEAEGLPHLSDAEVEEELQSEISFYQEKVAMLVLINQLIQKEQEFRKDGKVKRKPIGTDYYCDPSTASGQLTGTWTFTNASTTVTEGLAGGNALAELAINDYVKVSNGTQWYKVTAVTDDDNFEITPAFVEANVTDVADSTDYRTVSVADGTSMAKSYVVLDQFTEVARAAGDKLKVRRGQSERVSEWTDLTFSSDGDTENPIIIEADYDDDWSDFVNSAQTYTLVFGRKAILASANSDFVAGEWMCESTEAKRDWSYEVALVQDSDSGTDDGADSNKLIDTGKFGAIVLGTQVVNTTDAITGYVSELVDADEVEVTLDGRPSGSGGTIVVFDNGDTWTIASQIVLFLPYKGAISGAGKTLVRMPYAPIWNTPAGDFEVDIDSDDYWKFQDLHFRGTDINGVVELNSVVGHVFKDCVFEADESDDFGIKVVDDVFIGQVLKCRLYNCGRGLSVLSGAGAIRGEIKDCLFDANNLSGSVGIYAAPFGLCCPQDCEFKNHGSGDIKVEALSLYGTTSTVLGRNLLLSSATEVDAHLFAQFCKVYIEDFNQTVGDNRQLTGFSTAEGTPSIQSETTTVRGGGGATSIKCTPSTKLSANWELSKVLLFEYPIYAVKDVSKTYTVYFNLPAADFTAAPLASELWIEIEAWGHATNNHRKLTKSTGTVAADGNWNTLTVTVTPLQTGVAYLRAYYCKTKEDGKSNIFYTDTKIGVA